MTASQPLALMDSSGVMYWPPALLTRPSMRPWATTMAVMVVLTASSWRMSQGWKLTRPPCGHDLAGHVCSLSSLPAYQHHVGAQRGEFMRDAAADAGAAAGDDDDLAGKQAGLENGLVAHVEPFLAAFGQEVFPSAGAWMNSAMAASVRSSSVASFSRRTTAPTS
jgi:hypothetical protein